MYLCRFVILLTLADTLRHKVSVSNPLWGLDLRQSAGTPIRSLSPHRASTCGENRRPLTLPARVRARSRGRVRPHGCVGAGATRRNVSDHLRTTQVHGMHRHMCRHRASAGVRRRPQTRGHAHAHAHAPTHQTCGHAHHAHALTHTWGGVGWVHMYITWGDSVGRKGSGGNIRGGEWPLRAQGGPWWHTKALMRL